MATGGPCCSIRVAELQQILRFPRFLLSVNAILWQPLHLRHFNWTTVHKNVRYHEKAGYYWQRIFFIRVVWIVRVYHGHLKEKSCIARLAIWQNRSKDIKMSKSHTQYVSLSWSSGKNNTFLTILHSNHKDHDWTRDGKKKEPLFYLCTKNTKCELRSRPSATSVENQLEPVGEEEERRHA